MIAKHVPMRSLGKSDFAGLVQYITDAQSKTELDMARYLLTRSEGTIGELAHLLMAAAIVAVESGEEAINHRTLSMAVYTGPSERRRQFERELM